ncbi:hypothetical protein [Pseudoduganella violaceinigra]|uniref:hypothetical protein n=1 Tax=Pseudoduganella violaceinigra TaxID=246602 RepID=UPI0012B55721|nr:hypothetical protein [Pseudoduganella violaceinigra]
MLRFKKGMALALFAVGLGAGASAWAAHYATYEQCVDWINQCREGDVNACNAFDAGQCWRYDGY